MMKSDRRIPMMTACPSITHLVPVARLAMEAARFILDEARLVLDTALGVVKLQEREKTKPKLSSV